MEIKWKIIKGNQSILLVASHNYPQVRMSVVKPSDIGTGQLVKLLCKTTNAWGIISTSIQPDPNWYSNSPFRNEIKKLIKNDDIKCVLDIHGRRENYPHLLEILQNDSFKKTGTTISDNFHLANFVNNKQVTLAEDLDNDEVGCAEIEIRKDGRLKEINEKNYKIVVNELYKLIQTLSEKEVPNIVHQPLLIFEEYI